MDIKWNNESNKEMGISLIAGDAVTNCPLCEYNGILDSVWCPEQIDYDCIRYICLYQYANQKKQLELAYNYSNNKYNNLYYEHSYVLHKLDIPLCPYCGKIFTLYLLNYFDVNVNIKKKFKYCIKCPNNHLLPLTDLFCKTKKGNVICGGTYKLQWTYDTMVLRCSLQRNRDHDLWWVKYKGEWKQRRTIIRYKKELLAKLTVQQRQYFLGLVTEGELVPNPVFDLLVSGNYNLAAVTSLLDNITYTSIDNGKKFNNYENNNNGETGELYTENAHSYNEDNTGQHEIVRNEEINENNEKSSVMNWPIIEYNINANDSVTLNENTDKTKDNLYNNSNNRNDEFKFDSFCINSFDECLVNMNIINYDELSY